MRKSRKGRLPDKRSVCCGFAAGCFFTDKSQPDFGKQRRNKHSNDCIKMYRTISAAANMQKTEKPQGRIGESVQRTECMRNKLCDIK